MSRINSNTRFWVEVWTTEPGPGRYRDAHEKHRTERAQGWDCGTVEAVGRVHQLGHEYRTRAGAEAYADKLRTKWRDRFYVEIVQGFTLEDLFQGQPK